MRNIWDNLPTPFFILAPMDDVTDTVFRQIVAGCAPPDLFVTEFVNVDGLQSSGRKALLGKLQFGELERPILAQIWGKETKNYAKTAKELVSMGFDGIDINMGCPDRAIVKNGCCAAFILPENRGQAIDIIHAVQDSVGNDLPISVKTRLGFHDIDLSWHRLLLEQHLAALTIHWRTKTEMSKVPAHWDFATEIVRLRNELAPSTKIVGNGDVLTRSDGVSLINKFELDGVMIGRGVFQDPFVFAAQSPWRDMSPSAKTDLFRRHVDLFFKTWQHKERSMDSLKKFCKIYISGFEGAHELRENFMSCKTPDELGRALADASV